MCVIRWCANVGELGASSLRSLYAFAWRTTVRAEILILLYGGTAKCAINPQGVQEIDIDVCGDVALCIYVAFMVM